MVVISLLNSLKKPISHSISLVASVKAVNLASNVERAIVDDFLDF